MISENPVVYTNEAECRDCYRCLRHCPVKAIRMDSGQASVDTEKCIGCGTCIRECPQGAKTFRNDVEQAARLLRRGGPVAVSIAPSYVASFKDWERLRIPSALRKLGFTYVAETAIGADAVAKESRRLYEERGRRPSICTACPAVVEMIEKYHPQLCPLLLPVASPMKAHAAMIREELQQSDMAVVFIGPCVAKKVEADRSSGQQKIDCALTFVELCEWLEREGIRLDRLEDSDFDAESNSDSRLFPLPGGLARTAGLGSDSLDKHIVAVSGHEDVKSTIEGLEDCGDLLIEPLFCSGGCIGGPGALENGVQTRLSVIVDAQRTKPAKDSLLTPSALIRAEYAPAQMKDDDLVITEEMITQVLAATGKNSEADELDCGACGYDSCREKAIAVVKGLAETDMCIPYMRRLAEQRTDRIIETSPNGIVMLDERLNIISMNPAFRRMFMCSEAVLGRHISYLVDPEQFELVLTGTKQLVEETVQHPKYNLVAHQIIYKLEVEKQIVGIFVNITGSSKNQQELAKLKSNTVEQAREMLEHQIHMAQQMAKFLGESTAQGETIIQNLLKLVESGENNKNQRKGREWDIFTSK